MKIGICVPSHDLVHVGFTKSLSNLTAHLTKTGIDFEPCFGSGTVLSDMRIKIAKFALSRNVDYLMWFDSDMHFPKNTVNRLLEHKKDIVAATYSTRIKPQRSVAFIDEYDYDKRLIAKTGLHKVFAIGMGCVLVHRSVFETLPQPWFKHMWCSDTETFSGEDIYFCKTASDNGFDVFVDIDLSYEVAHYGTKAYLLRETNEGN